MKRFLTFLRVLRYLHMSIYFNFKYLPFRQAVKLPVFLYRPRFGVLGGGDFTRLSAFRDKDGYDLARLSCSTDVSQ